MSVGRGSIREALLSSVPRGSSLLIAVSGGLDSMALLHALLSAQRLLGATIQVAHIDHGIRADSHRDAQFVREYCESHGVPCSICVLAERAPNTNIEIWARKARYRELSKVRRAISADWVLTAHTSSDLIETFWMRLCANRSTGSFALKDGRRRLLRPFLKLSRTQLAAYVGKHEIPFREDPSNQSDDFLRNRVRSKLIPVMRETFGHSVDAALAERARRAEEDERGLWQLAQRSLPAEKAPPGSRRWLLSLRAALQGVPSALRWRMVALEISTWLGWKMSVRGAKGALAVIMGTARAVEISNAGRLYRRDGALLWLAATKPQALSGRS